MGLLLPTVPKVGSYDRGTSPGSAAVSPPAFGASIGNNAVGGASGTSIAVTTTGAVPAGGLVVVGVGHFGNALTANAISGGGLSWSQAVLAVAAPSATEYHSALWIANAPAGLASSTAITITYSGSVFQRTACAIYLTGASQVDATGTGESTSGVWAATFSTTAAATVVVAFAWVDVTTAANVAATNYTEAHDYPNTTDNGTAAMVYRVVSSSGSYTPGGQVGAPNGTKSITAAASFKA